MMVVIRFMIMILIMIMIMIMMVMITMMMAAPVEHCLDFGLWQDGGVALLQRLLIVVHLRHGDNRDNGDNRGKTDDGDDDDAAYKARQ